MSDMDTYQVRAHVSDKGGLTVLTLRVQIPNDVPRMNYLYPATEKIIKEQYPDMKLIGIWQYMEVEDETEEDA